MVITDFKYFKPATIKETIALLEEGKNPALLAGGTDLLVEIKKGLRHHEEIISLKNVQELNIISEEVDNIIIGAGVTHNELISSEVIRKNLPAISQAATKIGCEQIRNKGTVGGNICTAASCCDLGPILLALDASVEIAGSSGLKTVPLKDFFIFHRKTILVKGEVVTRIKVPRTEEGTGVYFEKFGLREAAAVSVASVAARVRLKNGSCEDSSIVIGAVAPTPKISQRSADLITGKKMADLTELSPILEQAGQAAAEDAIPIDDIRGGAKYRRDILKVLTQRAILKAISYAQKNREEA